MGRLGLLARRWPPSVQSSLALRDPGMSWNETRCTNRPGFHPACHYVAVVGIYDPVRQLPAPLVRREFMLPQHQHAIIAVEGDSQGDSQEPHDMVLKRVYFLVARC